MQTSSFVPHTHSSATHTILCVCVCVFVYCGRESLCFLCSHFVYKNVRLCTFTFVCSLAVARLFARTPSREQEKKKVDVYTLPKKIYTQNKCYNMGESDSKAAVAAVATTAAMTHREIE